VGHSPDDEEPANWYAEVNAIWPGIRALRSAPKIPHDTRGSSILRPAVFGATDGLVFNVCLIMGVTGASSEDAHGVVLVGIADLVAGGFSVAVGEYISVRSQH
jgi:VIT1/CCC1 family predicted Fe2+/Mn2+ transporter